MRPRNAATGSGRCAIAVGASIVGLWAAHALAAPQLSIDSSRFGNLFEAGEAPELRITLAADDEAVRGRLRVGATDAYGHRAGGAAFRIELAAGVTGTYAVPIRSERLGHFAIRATLTDARGRVVAQRDAMAGIVPPITESPAAESAVGYFVLPGDSELARAHEIAAQMRRLGIRWVRMTFTWWRDARALRPDTSDPGWLDTAAFEAWVDAFRANGIEVLGVLFGTARWASSDGDNTPPILGIPHWGLVAPRDLADWELFVRTLAGRLRGRVSSWEVWNEPDLTLFWQSSAADFVALVRTTAAVLRAVDPDTRVVVNVVNRESSTHLAFHQVVLTEAADVLDVFGYHYGSRASAVAADAVRPLLRSGGAIWNTEAWGAPRRHISRWLEQRAHGVDRVFPFMYHGPLDDSQEVGDFTRFGRYPVNLDFTPRVDAIALRTLSDLVGSATPTGSEEVGLGYSTHAFSTASGPVVALADGNDIGPTWSGRRGVRLWLEVAEDVRRVRVTDLMGNRQVLRVRRGRLRLTLRGVVAFLQADPPAVLNGLRVVRSRAARR